MKVFLVDPHLIYRRGLAALLAGADDVEPVGEADCAEAAMATPALAAADVVLLDGLAEEDHEFIRDVRDATGARVIVCTARCQADDILASVQAGAVGYLCKESLTPESLVAAVRAAADGAGVMPPDLLGKLLNGLGRLSRDVLEPRGLSLARLTPREQQVLSLVAEGLPTREVAAQLCYSERTVKNVLHDVVVKLNARSRSQAVACAVRAGLI